MKEINDYRFIPIYDKITHFESKLLFATAVKCMKNPFSCNSAFVVMTTVIRLADNVHCCSSGMLPVRPSSKFVESTSQL